MKLFNKEVQIIKKSDREPCDGVLDYGVHYKGFFEIHYCCWIFTADVKKYGFKQTIGWHPTYSAKTRSYKGIRCAILDGMKRMTREAYLQLKKYESK